MSTLCCPERDSGGLRPDTPDMSASFVQSWCQPPKGAVAPATVDGWWSAQTGWFSEHTPLVDRVLEGAFRCDRLGLAFCFGFHAALSRLFGQLRCDHRAALAATEDGGAAPRNIGTELNSGKLSGEKRFVTLAPHATQFLVVARDGVRSDGRAKIVVVSVPADAPGVTLLEPLMTPFCPEVTHAPVRFDDVDVATDQVLRGDGYADYLKPFRTVEDTFVQLAVTAYVAGVARRFAWPPEAFESLLAQAMGLSKVAEFDPRDPGTHLALAGLMRQGEQLLADLDHLWERVEAQERGRFERDRPLMRVASFARDARRTRAREHLDRA